MPENISSQFNRVYALPIETYRSVNSISNRNSIPGGVRWEGMHVYVAQAGEQKTYELRGGLTNDFWEPISDINLDVAVDIAFSETSQNPVQNQVITNGMYQRTQLQTSGQSQVHWDNITNTPTTLAGYGITDAPGAQTLSFTGGNLSISDGNSVNLDSRYYSEAESDDKFVPYGTASGGVDVDTLITGWDYIPKGSSTNTPPWATNDGSVLSHTTGPSNRQLWVGRLGEIGLRGGTGATPYTDVWIQVVTENNMGFGLSWNNTDNAIDFGEEKQDGSSNTWHVIEIPDGEAFSFGDPFLSANTPYMASQRFSNNYNTAIYSGIHTVGNAATVEVGSNATEGFWELIATIGGTGNSKIIRTLGATGIEVIDNVNSKGLVYDADYSANYTDRSIVDKAYVDSTSGGGGGTIVTGSLSTTDTSDPITEGEIKTYTTTLAGVTLTDHNNVTITGAVPPQLQLLNVFISADNTISFIFRNDTATSVSAFTVPYSVQTL